MGVYGTTLITSATPVVNGTSGRILYNNAGVVGEYTLTGTGTVVAMQTAPTFTGPVTISEAVGSSGLTITGATQTTSQPALNITQTWNAAQTFTAIKANVTDTSSNAASLLLDLQIGGTSRVAFTKAGVWKPGLSDGTVVDFGQSSAGIWRTANFGLNGVRAILGVGGTEVQYVAFTPTPQTAATQSSQLWYEAANVIGLRNGTNAQTFRVYNTYTSSTNYELAGLFWSSNVFHIGADKGSGGGTARVLQIDYGGTTTAAISVPITSGTITFGGAVQAGGASASFTANDGSSSATWDLLSSNRWHTSNNIGSQGIIQAVGFRLDYGTGDINLDRGGTGTLQQYSSSVNQGYWLFNTRTDASNGEWWTSNWASNVYHMGATKNGTGTSRAAQWDYGTTTTSAITVPSAITGTVVVAGGSVGATTALTLGGATQTATSGTYINAQATATYNPSSTSTMVAIPFYINPTINYSAGTPGAGSYEALKIAAVETALPTGGSYLIRASSGATGFTDRFLVEAAAGATTAAAGTAIPAGGTTGVGMKVSSTANFGVFFGSGAPSLSAAKGSLYLRSDGSGTTDRAYINTDGGTTWTALTTAA